MQRAKCNNCDRIWEVTDQQAGALAMQRCACGGRLALTTDAPFRVVRKSFVCPICGTSNYNGATPPADYKPRYKYQGERQLGLVGSMCCWKHEPVPLDWIEPTRQTPNTPEYAYAVAAVPLLVQWRVGKIKSVYPAEPAQLENQP